mgnify:CR=1 FL=1
MNFIIYTFENVCECIFEVAAQTFSPAGSSGACYIVIQTKQRRYCDVEAA